MCKLCEEGDISPNDLIPNPLLRKKVAAFKNATTGLQKTLEVSCGDLVSMSKVVLPLCAESDAY